MKQTPTSKNKRGGQPKKSTSKENAKGKRDGKSKNTNSSEKYQKPEKKGNKKRPFEKNKVTKVVKSSSKGTAKRSEDGKVRLNRFLSQAGVCSRREADELIATGVVEVNGEIITQLGTKVNPHQDIVKYAGEKVKAEKMQYVVLNKPKDFITTSKDPQNRKTVMHLVSNACIERIYPVGRLDKNTLGVLLFTNDGNLAQKLTHPKFNVQKTYIVETNKPITQEHINTILKGIELEDGFIKADELGYFDLKDKKAIVITLHSGKNRIVRRIFEHFDYNIKKLDRINFGGIDKKGLRRGQWRQLTETEIEFLKMN